jgi:proteasome lid subunit RPN8/RPN11
VSPSIALSRAAYDAVVDHALAAHPAEACGLLAGARGPAATVRAARRAENAAAEPETAYRIDPAALAAAVEAIEAAGDEVVGFYHSHPRGPPAPSDRDRAEAAWADHSYLLVALGGEHPVVSSWRHRAPDRFEPERVRVEPVA